MLQLWNLKEILEAKGKKKKGLQSLAAVEAHEKDINCVAISPNESLVCTTSQDRTAKVSLTKLKQCFRNLPGDGCNLSVLKALKQSP